MGKDHYKKKKTKTIIDYKLALTSLQKTKNPLAEEIGGRRLNVILRGFNLKEAVFDSNSQDSFGYSYHIKGDISVKIRNLFDETYEEILLKSKKNLYHLISMTDNFPPSQELYLEKAIEKMFLYLDERYDTFNRILES